MVVMKPLTMPISSLRTLATGDRQFVVQDALETLMQGRTSLVIAHRLSTVESADSIIVLQQGKIVEQGTHQELVERKGIYAQLWEHQSGGFLGDNSI